MNNVLNIALKRNGYRRMRDNIYGKPVAFQLFVILVRKEEVLFLNYFLGANGKVLLFSSCKIEDTVNSGGYETSIRTAEYSTRIDVGSCGFSADFGFLSPEEAYTDLLG